MLRTVWAKILRDYRAAVLGWGIGLALLLYAGLADYATQVNTPTARRAVAQLARSFRFFGEPTAVTTPGGYATWRYMGVLPALLGIWAVLAGARLLRREEERGALDIVLVTPRSRTRVLVEKLAALVTALTLIALLITLGALGGEAQAGVHVDVGGALVAGLNVGLAALLFALIALLLSQALRTAGAAGGLLALAYLVDGTGRVVAGADGVRRLSPLFYYSLSKPLIASYGANPGALLVLLALCAIFRGAGIALFLRRDIGGVVWPARVPRPHRRRRRPDMAGLTQAGRALSTRTVGLRALAAAAPSTLWWAAGLSLYAAWITVIARSTEDSLRRISASTPAVRELLGGQNIGADAGFLAGVLFTFLPVLLALFALVQAGRWASDLDTGRLEVVLSTPQSRGRVILARFGALLAALAGVTLAVGLVVLASVSIAGLHVGTGHIAAAALGMLPPELLTAALVYALAGRLPAGVVTGVVGGLIALAFFAALLDGVLRLPLWIVSLSVFYQYGSPITDGPRWGPWLIVTAGAAVVLALGVARFTRDDVQRGS